MNKKTLLFYNRRGTARAWLCEDCWYFEKCPHCDIAFAYHTYPTKRLVCHQCNTNAPFPIVCPHCHGHNIVWVGVGIERVNTDIRSVLWDGYSIMQIDSDSKKKVCDLYNEIDTHDVILATNLASTLVHSAIASVVFLSFESNLSIPEYDMEELLFDEISYYKKQGLPIFLQTYIPHHPLIHQVLMWNQKNFFDTLIQERKQFSYPPFAEFVTIRVHHEYQKNVTRMMSQLFHKIQLCNIDAIFIAADQDIWEKKNGEWSQKIILKWKNIMSILSQLEIEIVRNRSVSLEWN